MGLRQRKADLIKEAQRVFEKVRVEGRDLTAEEKERDDKITAELDGLNDDIKREERQLERERDIAGQSFRQEDPASDPEDKKKFKSLGEQLTAVANAAQPGQAVDPRLMIGAATGMGEGVQSDGGFLVQTDFSSEMLRDTIATGILSSRTRRIPIGPNSNGLKINAVDETSRASSRFGGIIAYWLAEAGTKTASAPKFRQIELDLKKLIGLFYSTDELLMDATALEGVVRGWFAEEFGFQVDDKIVNGSGAGVPLGILNAPALVSVTKETSQTAATIVAENIEKMYSRMPASSLARAEWYINQEIWPQLFQLHHAVGTGGFSVFVPGGNLAGGPFGTLLGRPIVPIEQAAALGTVGDIMFADLQKYLMIEKGGIQSASSIHVQFLTDQTVFRFTLRTDGQPIPNSARTPYKGSATQSPFVALATRA